MKCPYGSSLPSLIVGVGLAASLSALLASAATAQGYGLPSTSSKDIGPSPYAPPRGGVRPIDQSPRDGGLPIYQPSIWEGLYLGAHLGGDFGALWATVAPNDKLDLRGAGGGLHLGYNWQRGGFVGGVEFDADGKSTDGARGGELPAGVVGPLAVPLDFKAHAEWLSSARLRFGYGFGNALLYATGGYAISEMTVRASALGSSIKTSEVMQGYVLGGGIEWKFSPNISARLEGLHYEFTEKTFYFGSAGVRGDADLTTVRAGLTYHFN